MKTKGGRTGRAPRVNAVMALYAEVSFFWAGCNACVAPFFSKKEKLH